MFEFEWDPVKAAGNLQKHGVSFELAVSVFLDPLALSRFDPDHSNDEDRWLTLGRVSTGLVVVLVHTVREESSERLLMRVISARRATTRERRAYEEGR